MIISSKLWIDFLLLQCVFAHGQGELQAPRPGDANVWTRKKSGNTIADVLSGGLKAGAAAAAALDPFPSLKDFLPAVSAARLDQGVYKS